MMRKMIGVICNECKKVYYPKRSCCPNCKDIQIKEVEIGNTCTLITYTELWAVPKGIDKLPLTLGIFEFENGARVLGQIISKKIEIGMKFQPLWSKIRKINGKEIYGFIFESIS